MKGHTKNLIGLLKLSLDVAWVLNLVFVPVALGFLVYAFLHDDFTRLALPVNLPKAEMLKKVEEVTTPLQNVQLETKSATLSIQIVNTPVVITGSLLLLVAFELLILNTIYNLRLVFSNLKNGYSFSVQNVRSVKQAALSIALFFFLQLFIYMCAVLVIRLNIPSGYQLSLGPDPDFKILLIAAILYIVAEIFNSGLKLQEENEEFV
jgi:hypothetical protein